MSDPSKDHASLEAGPRRQRLRICHLAYTFYETDNRVLRYANALAERGADVEVFALRRPGQSAKAAVKGVSLFRIQRRSKTERAAITYLLKLVWFLLKAATLLSLRHLRKPYDVVHVHNVPDFLVFAAVVPKLLGARVILDIHDVLPELYAGKFGVEAESSIFRSMLLVERISCRFANHVIVANHLWHDRLSQRAALGERCTTILNYPDLRIFKPIPPEKARQDGKFIILYPGSLNRYQGLDVAIKAFDLIKDVVHNGELHIYGEGPARPELAELATKYGLRDRVFLLDPLPMDQIATVMAAANLGVEPKQAIGFSNEALSTKILEFMSCGVPVVASRTRVHSHYFADNVVRFFTPGDHEDLAKALVHAYVHYAERGVWVQRAVDFAAGYAWDRRVQDYLGLIDGLCPADTEPHVVGSQPRNELKVSK